MRCLTGSWPIISFLSTTREQRSRKWSTWCVLFPLLHDKSCNTVMSANLVVTTRTSGFFQIRLMVVTQNCRIILVIDLMRCGYSCRAQKAYAYCSNNQHVFMIILNNFCSFGMGSCY